MLQVPAEVDDMRGTDLDLAAVLARFPKDRSLGGVWGLGPTQPVIGGGAEADEGAEDVPVETAVRLIQTVRAVIPNTVVHQAATGVASPIRCGRGILDTKI